MDNKSKDIEVNGHSRYPTFENLVFCIWKKLEKRKWHFTKVVIKIFEMTQDWKNFISKIIRKS